MILVEIRYRNHTHPSSGRISNEPKKEREEGQMPSTIANYVSAKGSAQTPLGPKPRASCTEYALYSEFTLKGETNKV